MGAPVHVDGFTDERKRPSLRKRGDRLVVGGMKEGVCYKLTEINDPSFVSLEHSHDPARVGERMSICYDFKATKNCMHGLERLELFVWRVPKAPNIVRYFRNVEELEKTLAGIKFELDLDYGRKQLEKHRKEIAVLEEDYGLAE